jgi:hypothetical protein
MSVQADVRAALASFGYPVAESIYTDTESTYFVFTVNAIPADYADDAPQHVRNLIMLRLHCPHTADMTDKKKEIKLAVFNAGFTYPTETDASDDKTQIIVFEFENAEAV